MLSQQITCDRCGGDDFRVESGFYFCNECHLQSQDVREEIMEGFYGGNVLQRKHDGPSSVVKSKEQKKAQVSDKRSVSSWELMNYILKGLVDELILLGASKHLKAITLQLWASYLSKLEVAFTSTSVKKKPKLGLYHRKKDVTLFYKTSSHKSLSQIQRRKRKKPVSVARDTSSAGLTKKSKSHRLTSSKKDLAQVEYNESIGEGSVNNSILEVSSMSASLASLKSYNSSLAQDERIKYAKEGKREIAKFLRDVKTCKDKKKFHYNTIHQVRTSVQHVTMIKLVAILRIALLISGNDIHFGDMLRWADEGYFSLHCAEQLIPPDILLASGQVVLVENKVLSIVEVMKITREMAVFLDVSEDLISPRQIISRLVRRYCNMFNLPDTLAMGIEKLLDIDPPKISFFHGQMNYEGRAMGFMLYALKILIGLDEATEFSYIPRDGGLKWDDWCKEYVGRMAKKALHHHPTLCRLYPGSYIGRENALLSNWNESKTKPSKEHHEREFNMTPDVKESLQKLLSPLMCSLPEPSWKPGLGPKVQHSRGSPLAVLSQMVESPKQQREKKIRLIINKRSSEAERKKPKNMLVKLLDEDEEEPLTRPKVSPKKMNISWEEASSYEPLPDYVIWAYHRSDVTVKPSFTHMANHVFDEWAASTLPHTFLWLLSEFASSVYQHPCTIYVELVAVEKRFIAAPLKGTICW